MPPSSEFIVVFDHISDALLVDSNKREEGVLSLGPRLRVVCEIFTGFVDGQSQYDHNGGVVSLVKNELFLMI